MLKRDNKGRFVKGYKHSKDEILRMSLANRGKISWMKGKYHSRETKRRIGLASLDKKHSLETRQKISLSHKGKKKPWSKPPHGKGVNCPAWKGGNSKHYKTGYYSLEYKQWRKSVFERDGYICQVCRKVGVYLTAHHIKSFAHFPELRFDINNGITLCEECHKLTDNYKGKSKKHGAKRKRVYLVNMGG